MAIPPTPPMTPPPKPPQVRPAAPDAPPDMGAEPMEDGGAGELTQRVVAMIPEPKDGKYNPKVVRQLADQLAETWDAVSEFIPLPPLPMPLLPDTYDGTGKLPAPLVVAFTLLLTAVAETVGEAGARYMVDVEALVDDKALNKVEGQLALLAKDKKVRKALEEMAEPSATDEAEKPEPVGKGMKEPPPIPKGVASAL